MRKSKRFDAYIGFDVTQEQRAEVKRRAQADGRSMASWLRSRLSTLFEIDELSTNGSSLVPKSRDDEFSERI